MNINRDDDNLIESTRQGVGGKLWRPIRRIVEVNPTDDQIAKLQKGVHPPKTPGTSSTPIIPGIPMQLLSITATESPVKQQDRTFSQVSVSFTRDGGDKAYGFTRIYLKGYKGNSDPVLQTEGRESPITFLLETTGETISVIGMPVGLSGTTADIALAQSAAVVLDGVISAPPAPSISQALLTITAGATTVGQQFGFNFLSGQVADVVDGYWVYKVGAHSAPTPPASRFKYVKHNPQSSGAYTFQDVSGVSTNFYYVSAVNKVGLESSLTDSGAGGGVGGVTTTYRPSTANNSDYTPSAAAYDANESVSARGALTGNGSVSTTWSGFSAIVGSPTLVVLKVISSASTSSDGSTVALEYSTDNGASYTTMYSSGSGFGTQTNTATLSNVVDLTHVKVRATVTGAAFDSDNEQLIFEIWCEVTA
jgi:hypothetical protein